MKLNSTNVEKLFLSCLYKDGEDVSNAIVVQGVKLNVGFDPARIAKNRAEIENLLSQCHPNFLDNSEARGWSFLNFCLNNNEEQWTGVHAVCDNLICLGLAIGKVVFLLPRQLWNDLPGGVPYLQIKEISQKQNQPISHE